MLPSNKLLNTLPLTNNTGDIFGVYDWLCLESNNKKVEGKLSYKQKVTDKLIIFEPGFPGDGSTRLEKIWLEALLKEGWTVFAIRHSGTVINGKFSDIYINSKERRVLSEKNNELVIGGGLSLGIADWLLEPKVSLETLALDFKEVVLVGHSFGSLAICFSLLKVHAEHPELLSKVSRFISLSGTLGRARGGREDAILKQWQHYLEKSSTKERVLIGEIEKNMEALEQAYSFIHNHLKEFEKHIEFIAVVPWGKTRESCDELVHPVESLDFITTLGRGYLILDTLEQGNVSSGRMAHDMDELPKDFFARLINTKWLPEKQISKI